MRNLPNWASLAAVAAIALSFSLGSPVLPAAPAAAAAAEAGEAAGVAQAQATLAWRLIADAAQSPGGPIVSPASLLSAFSILYAGADAPMRSAILKAMSLTGPEAATGEDLLGRARKLFADADPAVLQSADYLVFAPGGKPPQAMLDELKKAGVENDMLDLSQLEAVKKVDAWVAAKTHGLIPELIGQPLDKPAFATLNALHFKAKWLETFDPAATSEAPFQAGDGSNDKVRLMRLPVSARAYRQSDGFVGVELPFAGDRFALVVVTSQDAPKPLADFAPVASWLSAAGFAPTQGDLALPRFALDGGGDLASALKADLAPGLASPTALAKFGGGKIDSVLQRARIEVTEEGAEAAAATAVIVSRSLASDDAIVHMVVDKPFLFALRDRKSGMILAAGFVAKAPKSKG